MIERLEQLTVSQFIDLVSGDTSVLCPENEIVSPTKLAMAMRNIIFEYKEIADEGGIKSYLSTAEDLISARISSVIFRMCDNLVLLKQYARAREVMEAYGINVNPMSDERLVAEIKSRIAKAKSTIERIESEIRAENYESQNIRREFDAQAAALMSYFKFQIDTSTMKATVYAHLVAQHNREVKAKIAALKK